MRLSGYLFALLFLVLGTGKAAADWPIGLWQSPPDRSGHIMQVRTKPCGAALCGRVERAKDRRGYDTPSRVVGQKVLLDMKKQSDGTFLGRMWEPERNQMLIARMQVQGNIMLFRNCKGDRCTDAIWKRVR